jgi:hypothetical protein
MNFNEQASDYNAFIRSLPKNICASVGIDNMACFSAREGADKAPEVQF